MRKTPKEKTVICFKCKLPFNTIARNAKNCIECRKLIKKEDNKIYADKVKPVKVEPFTPSKWLERGKIHYQGLPCTM